MLLCAPRSFGAPGLETVSNGKVTNLISLTFSHTVGSGANRVLIVGVTMTKSTKSCTNVTYGGTALTLIGESQSGDAAKAYLWKLASPPSATANVVVMCTGAENFGAGAMTFTNVDISDPHRTFTAASGSSTAPSVDVTSASGELVVDAIATKGDAISLAVGAGQTLQWTNKTGTAGGNSLGGGSTEAGASSVAMSWTLGASKEWSMGAVSLKPAPTVQADIQTTKTGSTNVLGSTNFTYTITVTNLGSATATNVVVSDTLPATATYFTSSSGGSHNAGVVSWPAFNLASGSSTTLTVTVTAPGSGTLTNTVSSSADTYDPNPSNNDGTDSSAKVVTTVTPLANTGADGSSSCVTATNVSSRTWSHTVSSGANRILIVGIALADTSETVSSVTYGGTALSRIISSATDNTVEIWRLVAPTVGTANIVATWTGNEDMAGWSGTFTNVDQGNPIGDSAAAFGSDNAPSVTVSAAAGDIVVDMLSANGDSGAVTVGAGQTQVCSGLTGTGSSDVRGAASYESGASSVTMSWSTVSSKDWEIAAVVLKPATSIAADIATTVTGPTNITAGAKITYFITVTNSGSSTAACVSVTNTLPAGVTFLGASDDGEESGGVVTWPLLNMASGASATYTVSVTAPGGGTITNIVTGGSLTYDPDSSNNDGSASNARVITTVTPAGNAGSDNSSCVAATNVSSRTWSHTVSSGNSRILIVGIALADTSETVSSVTYGGVELTRIIASASENTVEMWRLIAPTVGTANIVATWTGNKDMTGWGGTFTNVDQTTPIGDVQVASGSSDAPSVTVSAATGDVVVDTLSANGDSGTPTIGANQTPICDSTTGTSGGDVRGLSSYEAGASSVTMSWSTTSSKAWDIAAVVLKPAPPLQADIVTTKTGASTVYATSNLTYTITVTNCGPAPGSNIVVSDVLPTGSTFVSASSGGTNASGTVYWNITNMAYTALTNLTVTVTAPTSGMLTNTVSSTATTSDPDAANNNGSASSAKVITTVLQIADVKATKTGASTVYSTSNLTYTITLTNLGPNTATNVIVSDLLPTNTTFVSATSGGTNASGTVIWPTMTNWAIGSTTNFTVTITAPSSGGLMTNVVSATTTSTDPDASNNDGSASGAKAITTVLEIADIGTTKTGPASVYATSNLTYTITVTNLGPNTGTNVVVSDLLPTNTTFVSASSDGTNGNGTVWWPTLTNWPSGSTTNFTVTITAPASGVLLTNVVSSTATSADPDSSNNDGSASAAQVITDVTPIADIKTTKSGATNVYATSNLTYTITVTNLGPNSATNLVVSDLIPTNTTFVSASSGGTNGNGTVWWPRMTNFVAGATTNFTVTITAPATDGSITNKVSSTATTTDPDSSNNDGSASEARVITTVVTFADITVAKSGLTSVLAGNNLAYTVAVTNLGPSTASNVVVSDLLPTNVTFVSASSGGTNGSGTVWWPTLTNFASGASTNFIVTITTPLSIGSLTNSASGTSTTSDPDASNNNGSAATAKVITSVTGVVVSGYVYLDANANGHRETDEAGTGLTLYAKIFASTNVSGPALQAAAVNGTTGGYLLTNIIRNTYLIIVDDNATLSDVTPALASGWTGTEMPAQIRTNVAVGTVSLPDQDFGLVEALGISGKVFKDTGAGGGTANDGVANGTETGLAGVSVRLTDVAGTTNYATATTDSAGNYTLLIPGSVTNGATLKVVEANLGGYLSTGAGVGNTAGAYDRASDTVTFVYASGTTYSAVNFGDVPPNQFVADSQQANLPGTFVVHPHSFIAGSAGHVTMSVTNTSSPTLSGWTQVIFRDANCNGILDSGETVVSGAIAVSAGDRVCLAIKEFIPVAAPLGALDRLTVTATCSYTNASPALSTNAVLTDLTTVGTPTTPGLMLTKAVDKDTALPGETITYTITYLNKSSDVLRSVVLYDQTPAFTTFYSATNGALPNYLTNCVITAPGVGASGALRWTFGGTLAPAGSGTVTFQVIVAQ